VARWRGREQVPGVPAWVKHEVDGGFVLADWVEASDFQLEPAVAESAARARWIAQRSAWLMAHEDVADILLAQLRAMAEEVP
jgi:hypothetical protein